MEPSTYTEPAAVLDPADWVEQYGDALYRYAFSRLRDPEAAEEVVQQTFVSGLEHQQQFAGTGSQQGWLMGILKRKIIDAVRLRARAAPTESLDTADPLDRFFDRRGNWRRNVRETLLQPLDTVDRTEFWPVFEQCVDALPAKQASVFLLREMEELGSAEICKEMQISSSNLWVLLHRARVRLASCIKLRWLQEKD